MSRRGLGVVSVWVALLAVACSGSKKSTPLRIGAVVPQNGLLGAIGGDQVDAMNLALEEIDAAGGVSGKQVTLEVRDDASDPTLDADLVRGLAREGIGALVGGSFDDAAISAAAVAESNGIVEISPSATSPALSGISSFFFRTCASDALQGTILAERAHARVPEVTNVSILRTPDAFGLGIEASFVAELTGTAGSVTQSFDVPAGATSGEIAAVLTTAFAPAPQAILLLTHPAEAVQLVTDYVNSGNPEVVWYFTSALEHQQDFVNATINAGGVFSFPNEGTGPSSPSGAAWTGFDQRFFAKYGRHPLGGSHAANAYDAVYLLAMAMQKAGAAAAGPAIHDALAEMASGGTAVTPGDWASIAAAIDAGTDVDYQGASGSVDFDANGDVPGAFDVWKVNGPNIVTVETGVTP